MPARAGEESTCLEWLFVRLVGVRGQSGPSSLLMVNLPVLVVSLQKMANSTNISCLLTERQIECGLFLSDV